MAKRYEYSFQRIASKPVTYINYTMEVHEVVEAKYRKLIRDKALEGWEFVSAIPLQVSENNGNIIFSDLVFKREIAEEKL